MSLAAVVGWNPERFADDPTWALLHFAVNSSDVFTDEAENQELNPVQEENAAYPRGPAWQIVGGMPENAKPKDPPRQDSHPGQERTEHAE